MSVENKQAIEIPDKIFAVEYAGFWDFTIDGKYGDSLLNVLEYPNAEQIASEIQRRYNVHTDLLEALQNLVNANPNDSSWNYPAAFESAQKAINKATQS